MQLLVCVINREEMIDDLLAGFVELGVRGATVINSEGMARLVQRDVPIMAGLQSLLSRSRPHNTTVFSVIESDETVEQAIKLVERLCGGLRGPGTGIVFTVPVSRVTGLAPELPRETDGP